MTTGVTTTYAAAQAARDAIRALEDALRDSPDLPVTVDGQRQVIESLQQVAGALADLFPGFAAVLRTRPRSDATDSMRRRFTTAARHQRAACGHLESASRAISEDARRLQEQGPQAGSGNRAWHCTVTDLAGAAILQLKQTASELAADVRETRRSDDDTITATETCIYDAACYADNILLTAAERVLPAYRAAGAAAQAPRVMRPLQDAALAIRVGYCGIRTARAVINENKRTAASRP